MAKFVFNDRWLKAQPTPTKAEGQKSYAEKQVEGSLVISLSYGGSKTWRAVYYVNGKPRSAKLGTYPAMSIAQARLAQKRFQPPQAKDGLQPGRAKSFGEVAKVWLQDRVDRRGLRTAREMRRHIERYALPHWEKTAIHAIRRSDVNDLLRHIEREHGAQQADHVLSSLSSLFRWYAKEDDEFTPPVVAGMQRDPRPAQEQKRARILSDEEVRALWAATTEPTIYNGLVRFLLLSAQRWAKVIGMQHADLVEGLWTLPQESREKGSIGSVKLPALALQVIAETPQIAGSRFVFPTASGGRFGNEAVAKRRLDARLRELLPDMQPWVHHDLRRTARSLMSRARVSSEHAERVLGHVLPGVEGIYDRHRYDDEKAMALQKLADLIGDILDPQAASNVVPLRR